MVKNNAVLSALNPSVKRSFAALLLAGAVLAGCSKEVGGQVVAVVDGEEITLQEINAELAGLPIAEGADLKPIRQAALQRIVERRLLANAAREDGIEETPDYIIRKRQMEDGLLVQMMGAKVGRTIKMPEGGEVDRYITENPNMFEGRTLLLVDQIRFGTPTKNEYLQGLSQAKTMQEVVAVLDRFGIKYSRQDGQIDTANLTASLVNQIKAVPATEPFVLPGGAMVSVNLIKATRAVPLGGDNARPAAVQGYRNKQIADALQKRMNDERETADIQYQAGYEPPKAPAGKVEGADAAVAKPVTQ